LLSEREIIGGLIILVAVVLTNTVNNHERITGEFIPSVET
jgi:hypothetical protein